MNALLWRLAEYAEWYNWPPKRFWSRLLRHQDMKHGYSFYYIDDKERNKFNGPPRSDT